MSSKTRYFLPSSRPIYGVDVESCALLKDCLSDDPRGLRLGTHSLAGKVLNKEFLRVAFWDPYLSLFYK